MGTKERRTNTAIALVFLGIAAVCVAVGALAGTWWGVGLAGVLSYGVGLVGLYYNETSTND
jgi:hypothetical protein